MSLPLVQAESIAEGVKQSLAPYCTRIELAGSVRRGKSSPKDLEIVCIPRLVAGGLFSDEPEVDPGFIATVKRWRKVKGEPTGRYTQRVLPGGMVLDLFMADVDNYGSLLLVRTGDWEFNKHVMGTLLPRHGYKAEEGYVWKDGIKLPVREEAEMFWIAGLQWIEPQRRTLQALTGKGR